MSNIYTSWVVYYYFFMYSTYQCRNGQREEVQEQHRFHGDLLDPFWFRYEHVNLKRRRGRTKKEKQLRLTIVTPSPPELGSKSSSCRMENHRVVVYCQPRTWCSRRRTIVVSTAFVFFPVRVSTHCKKRARPLFDVGIKGQRKRQKFRRDRIPRLRDLFDDDGNV